MSSNGNKKDGENGPDNDNAWNGQSQADLEKRPLGFTPSSRSSFTQVFGSPQPDRGSSKSSDILGLDASHPPATENHADEDIERKALEDGSPTNPVIDPTAFPDGGVEAWTVVLGGFCALFASFGWITCIGVFQDYYQNHQLKSYSPSTISWIPSLETCMMFIIAPICGKVFDNYGPRYLLLVGTFLHVFGLMMTSISTNYYQILLSQGICSPIGAGTLFYPCVNSIATWFFKRRAFAIGISASGASIGGVIYPIMVAKLVPRVGFGWTMRICAFLILGLCIIANLTVKSRIKPQPKPFKLKDFVSPFLEMPFFLATTGIWLSLFGLYLPFTFMVSFARYHGMSPHLAGYLVSIMNATSTLGRIIPGYAADRLGRFNVMIIVSLVNVIVVLALWIPSRGNIPLILFTAVFGFSSGSMASLTPAVIAQISDVRQIGVRTGAMFAVTSIAALTGNPIGGALVGNIKQPTYWRMQLFTGMVMGAGSVFPDDVKLKGINQYVLAARTATSFQSGETIELPTSDPEKWPLPNWDLLEIQWILQRLTAQRGAADSPDTTLSESEDPSGYEYSDEEASDRINNRIDMQPIRQQLV
ncbi:hypothetical protein ACJ72_05887 [Emergomyces africanus]|uniref:Major facilitator superfamily (MFS) profile domain-containing protein n=1 Tax=Emergomyces africanus TaxID=1955775 RepID=A0A1B7NSN0_9EURO|nr:hypothetical protein ACJ72_05887 [Emergomyces africanus]